MSKFTFFCIKMDKKGNSNIMNRTSLTLLLFMILFFILTGCSKDTPDKDGGNHSPTSSSDKLIIFTSLFPIEDFTKKIGGSHVDVIPIMPPDSNAHTYEPRTKTMIEIAKGDAFIFSSAHMEPYAKTIAEALRDENVLLIEASKGLHFDETQQEDIGEHSQAEQNVDVDPHIWIDPILSIKLADNIKAGLQQLKPEAAEEFESNFKVLKKKLEDLDYSFLELIKEKRSPKMLVSHAAYGYWEKRYGIEQIAVSGLSSTNEPSQQQLQNIIDIAKENQLQFIIFEQNITTKVADVIKNEINAEVLRIHNLAVLTEADVKNQEDYFSLMYKNIEVLHKALD